MTQNRYPIAFARECQRFLFKTFRRLGCIANRGVTTRRLRRGLAEDPGALWGLDACPHVTRIGALPKPA
jgi:hypothetical protein